jgi:WD40-like Beta Propeller Repeat
MVVYLNKPTDQIRAFYCDTEGHVINYTAAFSNDGNTLTFLGDRQEGAPRYRLTYVRDEPGHMSVTLEMAQAAKPDDFQTIVKGKVRRLPSP